MVDTTLLDSVSMEPVLLNTFHILIFRGETTAQWHNAGFQEQEGYENFEEPAESPVADAQDLLAD